MYYCIIVKTRDHQHNTTNMQPTAPVAGLPWSTSTPTRRNLNNTLFCTTTSFCHDKNGHGPPPPDRRPRQQKRGVLLQFVSGSYHTPLSTFVYTFYVSQSSEERFCTAVRGKPFFPSCACPRKAFEEPIGTAKDNPRPSSSHT